MTEGRRGAVRSERSRRAILAATASQLAERGYEHLTMEGIAAEAHVGKQTIYRWWGSKGALIAECLMEGLLLPDSLVPPDTGDVRADLASWLDGIIGQLERPGSAGIVRSLIAAAVENDEVGTRLSEALGVPSVLVARLESAARSGDLDPHVPVRETSEALVGAIVIRALMHGSLAPGTGAAIVRAVLH